MVDPLTALAVASAAVGQIRTLVSAGQDATEALSSFAGAWSDINYAEQRAKNPPWYASFSSSAEKEAMEIFASKRKFLELKREVENLIMFNHGPRGLEEYKDILRGVREQRRKHEYRRKEVQENLITAVVTILAVTSAIALFAFVVYLIGAKQGRW
ncbi:MAG: hypothetical protein GY820_11285 [Gammaproteobacteria bacterium]|nr:hypothetical protein [Gammaproteobacteria bacterium]